MAEHVTLAAPFVQPRQQRQADFLGMYVFLGAETMMFGALIGLVYAYRSAHPGAAAEAASHLRIWIATGNTALLLTSSLAVAFAVHAAREGSRRTAAACLAGALALGSAFLALKGVEYAIDLREGLAPFAAPDSPLGRSAGQLFIDLYFAATGLHAVHMLVGMGLLAWCGARLLQRRTRVPEQAVVVEMTGLYWHFVDVVWVFIFPVFYLVRT